MGKSHAPGEPQYRVSFWRVGPEAFEGELYLRGQRFQDFSLTSSVDPIPQDAIDAVAAARALLESGEPNAFQQAIEVLQAVSTGVVASWP